MLSGQVADEFADVDRVDQVRCWIGDGYGGQQVSTDGSGGLWIPTCGSAAWGNFVT
jgi:hypothetical protein